MTRPRTLGSACALIVGAALTLLATAGCRQSTGLDECPPDALDCGQPAWRIFVLTVHVVSEGGAAIPGASVRVEAPTVGGPGVYRYYVTDARGYALFDFSYQGTHLRAPMPIEILVTPPEGAPLSAATASDTVVIKKTDTFRVLPVTLRPLPAYRAQ